jgi:hypothetical protein
MLGRLQSGSPKQPADTVVKYSPFTSRIHSHLEQESCNVNVLAYDVE